MILKCGVIAIVLTLVSCGPTSSSGNHDDELRSGIYNGKLLQIGDFPASRSLILVQRTNNGSSATFCTGVVIAPHIGLTAGHCFDDSEIKSNGFKIVFDTNQWGSPSRIRLGKSFRIHPSFKANPEVITFDFGNGQTKSITLNLRNDLAIFSFYGDLPADAKPANIYSQPTDLSNEPIYIYGAGHSQYISEKTYNVHDFNSGVFGYLRRGKAKINFDYTRYPEFYFTDPLSESKTCRGDSGGPQFLGSASYPTVVGINSAMIVNDLNGQNVDSLCGHTAVVTKIAPLAPWIEQTKSELLQELTK